MKKILKGIWESLKELAVIKEVVKGTIKNIIYTIIGCLYLLDLILDKFYDFISAFYKKINRRLQKILLYLTIILAITGVLSFYKQTIVREVIVQEKPTTSENMAYIEPIVEEVKSVETPTCSYDEVSCKIKTYADAVGLDYKLAIAIAKWETGNYTSLAFKSKNNVGGMMKNASLITFDNLDIGIDSFVKLLKHNYVDKGLDTIEKIQPVYCPIGTNDNGTNQYWIGGVNRIYNEL